MKENKLVDLSMDFAVKSIRLCENIKGHYSLVNQLERSATSIGANIHEANYAHGKPDFIAKLQVEGLDINPTSYSKLEGQVRFATDKEVYTIARVLQVEIEKLFTEGE